MPLTILFFGDLVGKISRRALAAALPEYKREYQPDLVIANAENAAHGCGLTKKIFDELRRVGIDAMTLGDHAFDKEEARELVADPVNHVIRPGNMVGDLPGSGSMVIEVGTKKVLVINLLGQVFVKTESTNPFIALDEILKQHKEKYAAILVDFHSEASSEKTAFGWYADGRVSAVLGTHTHIPTADAKILPQGTGYVSDVGMVGAVDSVIGVNKDTIIRMFLEDKKYPKEPVEEGVCTIGAVLIEIDPRTGKALNIKRIDKTAAV